MDNEHTTITGRQANPSRPEQINSLSINDRSLFSVFFPPMSFSAPTFSICQTAEKGWARAQIRPKRSSWGNTVAGVLTEISNKIHMPMSLTHSLTRKHLNLSNLLFFLRGFPGFTLSLRMAISFVEGQLPRLILHGEVMVFIFWPHWEEHGVRWLFFMGL